MLERTVKQVSYTMVTEIMLFITYYYCFWLKVLHSSWPMRFVVRLKADDEYTDLGIPHSPKEKVYKTP